MTERNKHSADASATLRPEAEQQEQVEKREAAVAFLASFIRVFERKTLEQLVFPKASRRAVERGLSQAIAKVLLCLTKEDFGPLQAAKLEREQGGEEVVEQTSDLKTITESFFRFLVADLKCLERYEALVYGRSEVRTLKILQWTRARPKADKELNEVARCTVTMTPHYKNGQFLVGEVGSPIPNEGVRRLKLTPSQAIANTGLRPGGPYPQYGQKMGEEGELIYILG
jgi:hypothetical protein